MKSLPIALHLLTQPQLMMASPALLGGLAEDTAEALTDLLQSKLVHLGLTSVMASSHPENEYEFPFVIHAIGSATVPHELQIGYPDRPSTMEGIVNAFLQNGVCMLLKGSGSQKNNYYLFRFFYVGSELQWSNDAVFSDLNLNARKNGHVISYKFCWAMLESAQARYDSRLFMALFSGDDLPNESLHNMMAFLSKISIFMAEKDADPFFSLAQNGFRD